MRTKKKQSAPKIMIFDIETSPNVGYFWRPGYNVTLSVDNIIEERQIICIAWKWVGEKKVNVLSWDFKKGKDKDKALLKKFSKEYAKADLVVAHNGDKFDIKWIKGRLLKHGLAPLSKVKQCDTLKLARASFNLNSNRLDYIAKFLGHEGKSPMGFGDWKEVMRGSIKALNKMSSYCKQDVLILEKVYLDLKIHAESSGIAQAFLQDKEVCPECGSSNRRKHGLYYTKVGKFQKYRCMDCFHNWRDSKQVKKDND